MERYTHLFKKPDPSQESLPEIVRDALNPIPVGTEVKDIRSTSVSEKVVEKVGRDVLLRMYALEKALEFVSSRPVSEEKVGEVFDLFYEKIKNGTKQQELLEQYFRKANSQNR